MENETLREILTELEGLRGESAATNNRLDGLRDSVVVLQQGVADVTHELQKINGVINRTQIR